MLLLFQTIAVTGFNQTIPNEQQLENETALNADAEIDDDSYVQQMLHYLKHPINLNDNDPGLNALLILSPLQINNFNSYKKIFGPFLSIYELQAIPGWDINLINRILPYVFVGSVNSITQTVKQRFYNGEHSLLFRVSQVVEKSKGYKSNDTTRKNYYLGSPQKLLFRYKYVYKNSMQFGVTGEKDAGENFLKGSQKQGFDFYSIHFFVRDIKSIKAFALGDYTINLGQGLTQWQSLAFKKSSDVINIKRQSAVLRPYNSAGEVNFHRGAAITLKQNRLEFTGFISYKKLDGNFVADTLNNEDYISSLQTSGYHRTQAEIADKNVQTQFVYGGNIKYTKREFSAGINAINYSFKLPIKKDADLYNKYTITGKQLANYSIDYSYTHRNAHFFGEAAIDNHINKAVVAGMLLAADAKVNLSFLYRNISKEYQSLYTNAFTESTYPNNEKGFYTGVAVNPSGKLRIDAYIDFYKFPWLKYGVDAPSYGTDYLVQLTYVPDKKVQVYSRYRTETKAINYTTDLVLASVQGIPKQNWRTGFIYKISEAIIIRSRVELQWYNKNGMNPESGFLTYADVLYKPKMERFSGNIRFQYFETDGYNSRLYAYENDVLYSYSIPVFYGKGYRYYFNGQYSISKNLKAWVHIAETFFPDKSSIGSGLDEIIGNKKTEIKFQIIYKIY